MKHIMLDIDGTLVDSFGFDEQCFLEAVEQVTGIKLINNWETYPDITDRGILKTFIERQSVQYQLEELESLVKPIFISLIDKHLKRQPAVEICGSKQFVSHLHQCSGVLVSVATGGWEETAKLKLESACFDTSRLVIASSNDHHQRIEIMTEAKRRVDPNSEYPVTYFGDGEWDKRACDQLGINLVIVGNCVQHSQQISDFSCTATALKFVR